MLNFFPYQSYGVESMSFKAAVTQTSISKDQQKKAHDVLLRAYKQAGMTHPPCSVPGCKGYSPSKKSMLSDYQAFYSYLKRAHGQGV
jgi:hypothetical protein